jgi:HSP20 family protein
MRRLFEAVEGASRDYSGVYPPLNITQDTDNFFVRAELAGVKLEDIELSAVRNKLAISGKREITEENASYHRREREGGTFSRSVTLPSEVDGERVEARYDNGMLTVVLPKAEEAKPRQIAIKTS